MTAFWNVNYFRTICPPVYLALVEEVDKALPTLHRYYKLRARMLGVEQLHSCDVYPPLILLDREFSFEDSKKISFGRFLYALGIRYVGEHVARVIADEFNSLESLSCASCSDLKAIDGIGPVAAKSVESFLNEFENIKTIDRILDSGVQIFYETYNKDKRLYGKLFVLTGTLDGMARNLAKEMIEAAGGKVGGSVSRNTDYLVVGKSPGSKLARARSLGVEIIDEEFLKKLLG